MITGHNVSAAICITGVLVASAVLNWLSGTVFRGHKSFAGLLTLVASPIVMASLLLNKSVSWRGRSYDISSDGTLREVEVV